MECVAKLPCTQTRCGRWLRYTKGVFPSWKLSIMPFRKLKESLGWLCSWCPQRLCARSCPLPHSGSMTILLLFLTHIIPAVILTPEVQHGWKMCSSFCDIKAPLTGGIFSSCIDRQDGRSDFITHITGDKSRNPTELELSYEELHSNATVIL